MKCISCEAEVDPKWTSAVNSNICPFCGKHIVEERLKDLLSNLRNTLVELEEAYPEQLNDWMLSNFNFIKTDKVQMKSVEVPKDTFTVKVKKDNGEEEEIFAQKMKSDEEASEFSKRAEVKLTSGDKKFRSVAERTKYLQGIKKQIETGESPYVSDEEEEEESSLVSIDYGDPDEANSSIPDVLLQLSQANNQRERKDLFKLQQMQQRREQSIENFQSGENRSKKGGFSRVG